jgi:DNA-binding NarL/FixJ family response regulator
MSIRIAVVEDDLEYRAALIDYIQANGFEVCATFSSVLTANKDLPRTFPDIVIVDIGLPDGSGLQCIGELKEVCPAMAFVVLSVHVDDEMIFRAIQLGASGYICKSDSFEKIAEALREVYNGEAFLSTPVARRVLDHVRKHPVIPEPAEGLTEREYEIVQLLSRGLSYKEIAADLYVSTETVRRHIHNVYKKLRVRNRTQALIILSGHNEVSPNVRK